MIHSFDALNIVGYSVFSKKSLAIDPTRLKPATPILPW
jgi:hypothetical protein